MCAITGIFTSTVTCSESLKKYVCNMIYNEKLYYDNFYNYYESGYNMLVRLIVIFFGVLTFFLVFIIVLWLLNILLLFM